MTNGRRQFATVALIAFCWLGHLTGHAETNPKTRAASVLFKQYETVAYTRTDFLSNTDALTPNDVDSVVNLRLPFLELIGGLKALGPSTASDLAKSYTTVFVGAKDFGDPDGPDGLDRESEDLGMFSSRKCYIGISESGTQPNVESDFSQVSRESIEGRQVWT